LREPKALAFFLLSRLGWKNDPIFVWYVLDLLLRVPDEVFEEKAIRAALLPLEGLPGRTIREKISICQTVILKMFGLWKTVAEAAEVMPDYSAPK